MTPTFWSRFHAHPRVVHAVTLVLVTVAAFANSLTNSFHLDDFYRVVGNPGIAQVSRPWVHFVDPGTLSTLGRIGAFRPLLPLSLSINHAIHGQHVVGYHVGNIALQLLAAWMVYLLVLELLLLAAPAFVPAERHGAVAWWVALMFAIHPVGGIAVNYICARDQLLMQFFLGAALVLYLRLRRTRFTLPGWLGVMGLVLLSLLSKGDGVVVPALVVVLELTVGRARWRQASVYARAVPFAAAVASLFLYTRYVLNFSETGNVIKQGMPNMWTWPLTQARLHLWRYLPQFVWPIPMRQDPDEALATGVDFQVATGVVFIVGSVVLAWWLRNRAPLGALCILAYWLMMATTSSVVPLHHIAVDYRPYPSSVYLWLGLVLLVLWRVHNARVVRGLAVAAVVWSGATTVVNNRTWRTEETLWRHAVDNGAGPLAHLNLAMSTPDLEKRAQLLETALRMAPDYILVLVNLGRTQVGLQRVELGLAYLEKAARLSPKDAQVQFWYAVTLAELGRHAQAAQHSALAVRLEPRHAQYLHRAALDAQQTGDHAATLRYLDTLDTVLADYQDAAFMRGFSLQQLGRVDQAEAVYERFLATHPQHVQARFNLAFSRLQRGQCAQAIPDFERVLTLRPGYLAAHLHLATCYNTLGQPERARPHQEKWDLANPPTQSP